MTELLTRAAATINRRRFIKTSLASVFAVGSGLAVGVPRALATNCCSFPGGFCGGLECSGSVCHSHVPDVTCGYDLTYWPNGCWADTCSSGTCCDCTCCDTGDGNCVSCGCYG